MASQDKGGPTPARLYLLILILFVSYLCVAMALPIVPVYVTGRLGFGNVAAGLAVGVAFLSTIVSRGRAGGITDRLGARTAVCAGLGFYVAGALASALAGLPALPPLPTFLILLAGRLVIGVGESLVAVGVIGWGIGLVGPARSGRVLALVGAALYGALGVGGPLGLLLFDQVGFVGAMLVAAVLPGLGLMAIAGLAGVPPQPAAVRPPFWAVIGRIWPHGLVICLQGIGFAAIGAFFALYFIARDWSHAGLGLTAFGAGFVLMRVLFGHLPDRIGGLPVAIGSLAVETVGQFLIWGVPHPVAALTGAFLTGLGCSMIFPAMGREVVGLVEPHLRGTALGGFSAFQDLAYGLTGPLAGLLADRAGYGSVFLVGGLAAGVGFLVAAALRARQAAV
ncbi:MFS transporter [Aurantimonas sp. MSK8Z-1]|uniref:MFS transporter n=1 Tax=Mangrovibrevibacter kandeliae TaxID=2968473 RepID=UPI002118D182|nr:MFS transporter [Aurantimonas sp. MSK8Z-1]MCW4113632.1 MFS transporter [Aurantimonas sp. MSK8Z-1]